MKYIIIFLGVSVVTSLAFFTLLRWERADQFVHQREMHELCLKHSSESSSSSDLCSHIAYTEIANISREYSANSFILSSLAAILGLSIAMAALVNGMERELKELRKRLDA